VLLQHRVQVLDGAQVSPLALALLVAIACPLPISGHEDYASRVRVPLAVAFVVLITLVVPAPFAQAHHGFGGRYDRSRPLYIEGQITQATYIQPHGLITIEPSPPAPPPADLLRLNERQYSDLGGREVVTKAQPIQATGGGVLVLLLTPPMTSTVAGFPAPPARGQNVGAIVFKECSTGELRVQLLRLSPTQILVRQGVLQREVDGCEEPTPSPVAVAPTAIPNVPVAVETKERADGGSALLLVAAAAAAGVAALAIGVLLARRRTP
jgi:hypothetical protein